MDNERIDEVSERRISRRSVIKRTAGATAVFWAAPAITTLGSRAYAESPNRCDSRDFRCDVIPTQCGNAGSLGFCFCDVDAEGRVLCSENYFCAGAQACVTSDDCPGGFRCATNCCPGQTCAPICGAGVYRVEVGQTGTTAAGT